MGPKKQNAPTGSLIPEVIKKLTRVVSCSASYALELIRFEGFKISWSKGIVSRSECV